MPKSPRDTKPCPFLSKMYSCTVIKNQLLSHFAGDFHNLWENAWDGQWDHPDGPHVILATLNIHNEATWNLAEKPESTFFHHHFSSSFGTGKCCQSKQQQAFFPYAYLLFEQAGIIEYHLTTASAQSKYLWTAVFLTLSDITAAVRICPLRWIRLNVCIRIFASLHWLPDGVNKALHQNAVSRHVHSTSVQWLFLLFEKNDHGVSRFSLIWCHSMSDRIYHVVLFCIFRHTHIC